MARSREPQHLDDHNWYYEQLTHLLLVHKVRAPDGAYIQTDSVKIPWRKIEQSIKRARPKRRTNQ